MVFSILTKSSNSFIQSIQYIMSSSPIVVSTPNPNDNKIKTYRHEFGKEFMERLSAFSKIHQYSDRHTYKAEWNKWTQQEEIVKLIDIEKRCLVENDYTGDIDDKMFKAGRYYFRKKNNNDNNDAATTTPTAAAATTPTSTDNTQQQQQQQRRAYITMSKHTIALMDGHIKMIHDTQASKFKPSFCYNDFYQTQMASPEMTAEIEKIIEKFQKCADTSKFTPDELTNEIIDKIKKTYKNRYYKFVSTHGESGSA